jgi:hypothetical protein
MSFCSPGGEAPQTWPNGTWLEAEAFAYPNDTFTRRAYATMPDGTKRVIMCKVPDTFFSIPARVRLGKKTVKGFLSTDEEGLKFRPYDDQENGN